jgi:hypothetical protein
VGELDRHAARALAPQLHEALEADSSAEGVDNGVGGRFGDREPKILQRRIGNALGTGELHRCVADAADLFGQRGDAPRCG